MGTTTQVCRPTWLKVALAFFSGWLTLLLSFFFFALTITAASETLFKTKGIQGIYGIVTLLAFVLLGLAAGVGVSLWQHRFLGRKPLKTNYTILAILVLLSLLLTPAPFTFVIMD